MHLGTNVVLAIHAHLYANRALAGGTGAANSLPSLSVARELTSRYRVWLNSSRPGRQLKDSTLPFSPALVQDWQKRAEL